MRNKYFLVPILFVLFGCGQDSPNVQQISNMKFFIENQSYDCLLYTSPSPRDRQKSRMPSSA